MSTVDYKKIATELDAIASEFEHLDPRVSLALDQISDKLEITAGVGEKITDLIKRGWKWLKTKAVDEPTTEKVLKEHGIEWDDKKVRTAPFERNTVEYYYKGNLVAAWSDIQKQVCVPDMYGNPTKGLVKKADD